jgi:NIMA (never in mitosis gene a)-related kinase
LLCEQNDQKIVKASDFGFSRKNAKDNRVRTGDGTVQYIWPKVLKLYLNQEYPEETKKYVGKVRSSTPTKDDIWTLGVCLYEMIDDFRPFKEYQNQKLFKMLDKQINKEIQPFKEGVSSELKNLIYSMLELDSNKRLDINGVKNHIWLRQQ